MLNLLVMQNSWQINKNLCWNILKTMKITLVSNSEKISSNFHFSIKTSFFELKSQHHVLFQDFQKIFIFKL